MEPIEAWITVRKMMDFFVNEKECLKKLLELESVDINEIKDLYGNTLLHDAASMGDAELVEQLLRYGADPNIKNESGMTPLHLATNAEVARKLIKYVYVNERDRDDRTPLHYAAYHGHIDVIETLLENDAFIDAVDREGQTPLHLALMEKRTQIAKLLLSHGADPNIKNKKSGETPLHLAIRIGNDELIKMMIERGADVNAQDGEGRTPLHIATLKAYSEIVKLLLRYGANPNLRDKSGKTPLDIAARLCREGLQGCFEIFELLFQHSSDDVKTSALNELLYEEQRKVLTLYRIGII